jgi:hypothetical protein
MNTEHCEFQAVLFEDQNLMLLAGYMKLFMRSCFSWCAYLFLHDDWGPSTSSDSHFSCHIETYVEPKYTPEILLWVQPISSQVIFNKRNICMCSDKQRIHIK